MSFALLWIEVAAVSLLWVATLTACTARMKRNWARRMAVAAVAILPLAVLGGFVATAAVLKFGAQLETNWFEYAVSLLAVYLIGTIAIIRQGARRPEAGMGRRAVGWSRGRLALALLTVAAITTMTIWNMDLEMRGRAASMRVEAGALMVAVAPPSTSDAQNAALVYEKAFTRIAADAALREASSTWDDQTPDLAEPTTAAILARHASTIAMLRQAGALPECRFEHDFAHPSFSILLPELAQVRTAASLLRLHARSEIAQGRVNSAMTDMGAIFQLGAHLGREPLIVCSMIAFGIDSFGANALQEMLPAVTRPEQLAGLNIADASSIPHIMRRSLQGEEAFGLTTFADVAAGRLSEFDVRGISVPPESSGVPSLGDAFAGGLFRLFLLTDDVDAYRSAMQQFQQAAVEPYSQSRTRLAQIERGIQEHPKGLLTNVIIPALMTSTKRSARVQAMHEMAQAAVAATRYRLDRGAFPAKLADLMPKYLDEVPVDPFDGNPLRMSVKDGSVVIYSIGPDGKDDGGAPFDDKKHTGDFVFHLKPPIPATQPATAPAEK
ncbi:MAG: hypothetical protein JWL69_4513 [Phycisphaerales bacterium]|nr:hypothetical protein [Phycisphaerales bacterium]